LASTLFRCCLPCCGGKSAPATKDFVPPDKQQESTYTYPSTTNNTTMSTQLPHIDEEEEFDAAKSHKLTPDVHRSSEGELKSALSSLLTPSPKSKQLRVKINEKNKIFLPNTSIELDTTLSGSGASSSKMQGEKGSIADLQKYQSRYLKNRRHTLANVR
jgi:hypothetical protein